MKVIVQHRDKKLFLAKSEQWTPKRSEAREFATAIEAIAFCIHCCARKTKLLGQNEAGTDVYLYPFGGDPAVRLARRKLRRSIREGQRLKWERRLLRARMHTLIAQRKEEKEKHAFPRNQAADGVEPANS